MTLRLSVWETAATLANAHCDRGHARMTAVESRLGRSPVTLAKPARLSVLAIALPRMRTSIHGPTRIGQPHCADSLSCNMKESSGI
jgi:hypothetical protein